MNKNIEQHLKLIEQALGAFSALVDNSNSSTAMGYALSKGVVACDNIRAELKAQADSQQYEGWSNRETWLVAELFKDKANPYASDLIEELSGLDNMRIESKANMVKTFINDYYIKSENPLQHKLTKSAIDNINFTEIAEKLIEEAKTQPQEKL